MWSRIGEMWLDRLEVADDDRRRAELRLNRGLIAHHRGDLARAEEEVRAAQELNDRLGDKKGIAAARIHEALAIVASDRGDYARAILEGRRALALRERCSARITRTPPAPATTSPSRSSPSARWMRPRSRSAAPWRSARRPSAPRTPRSATRSPTSPTSPIVASTSPRRSPPTAAPWRSPRSATARLIRTPRPSTTTSVAS
jgi:tetratricopeptide (TPR) repeat protein